MIWRGALLPPSQGLWRTRATPSTDRPKGRSTTPPRRSCTSSSPPGSDAFVNFSARTRRSASLPNAGPTYGQLNPNIVRGRALGAFVAGATPRVALGSRPKVRAAITATRARNRSPLESGCLLARTEEGQRTRRRISPRRLRELRRAENLNLPTYR